MLNLIFKRMFELKDMFYYVVSCYTSLDSDAGKPGKRLLCDDRRYAIPLLTVTPTAACPLPRACSRPVRNVRV